MLPPDEMDAPSTTPELRARRLGSALRGLAAELVHERRKVAELRHQVAELEARLESVKRTTRSDAMPERVPPQS
jgi:uncharacterized coiled-coil protein SlyX